MPDAQALLRARGIKPISIERTEPREGERYIIGHRVIRMPAFEREAAPIPTDRPRSLLAGLLGLFGRWW